MHSISDIYFIANTVAMTHYVLISLDVEKTVMIGSGLNNNPIYMQKRVLSMTLNSPHLVGI